MPLPIGSWSINQGGVRGQLTINAVDVAGNVTGISPGAAVQDLFGFWNEPAQKLTFIGGGKFFTAYLFVDQFRMPGIVGAKVFTLAGVSTVLPTAIPAIAATVRRPVSGWYAQIGTA